MKKLLVTLAGGLLAVTADADVGWSYAQCEQAWGKPTSSAVLQNRFMGTTYIYDFSSNGLYITVVIKSGHVSMQSRSQSKFIKVLTFE
jgi:hypothetical protein